VKKQFIIIGLLTAVLLLNVACNAAVNADIVESDHMANDDHMDEGDDHTHTHVAPPREFAGLGNPFAEDEAAIAAGKETYDIFCATCHGPEGSGDGVAAEGLDPKPASLADGMMMRELSEGYLFWRISTGGAMEPFNSAMPAWESTLSEEQRWQVISYIRTLANDNTNMDDNHMDENHMDEGN
jgi:mono/diheme cytochrome c family protein